MPNESSYRDEFTTPCSAEGLKVVQVTSDAGRDSYAYYLDTPSWTPDSQRFAFHREAGDNGAGPPGMWLCDTGDGFSIRPVCEYRSGHNPADPKDGESYGCVLSPDGAAAYEMVRAGDRVEVRRIPLDGGAREAVCAAPAPLRSRGSFTMSADGRRLCMGNFLGDGRTEGAPWGATIFDVSAGKWWTIEFGNGYRNMHCVYSPDPSSYDIALDASPPKLSDGSWLTPPDGSWRWQDLPPDDGLGAAVTVVRDDGTDWRMTPIGRDRLTIISHNVWRGRTGSIVCSAYHFPEGRWRSAFFEAAPVPAGADDLLRGEHMPGTRNVDLTRYLPRADGCHFGFDHSGRHFVSDTDGYAYPQHCYVYIGTRVKPDWGDPYVRVKYLLLPRTSWKSQPAHPHPYLSPDGRFAVVQSDFFGRPQVFVAFGYEFP